MLDWREGNLIPYKSRTPPELPYKTISILNENHPIASPQFKIQNSKFHQPVIDAILLYFSFLAEPKEVANAILNVGF